MGLDSSQYFCSVLDLYRLLIRVAAVCKLGNNSWNWIWLDLSGHCWTYLDIFGPIWTRPDIAEYFLIYLDITGQIWTQLDIAGQIWANSLHKRGSRTRLNIACCPSEMSSHLFVCWGPTYLFDFQTLVYPMQSSSEIWVRYQCQKESNIHEHHLSFLGDSQMRCVGTITTCVWDPPSHNITLYHNTLHYVTLCVGPITTCRHRIKCQRVFGAEC